MIVKLMAMPGLRARLRPLTAVFMLLTASQAMAALWNAGTADWFTGGNWTGGVPTTTDNAGIHNAGTAQIGAAGAVAANIRLGNNDGDDGNISITAGGTLTTQPSSFTFIGNGGGSGTGTGSITVSGAGASWIANHTAATLKLQIGRTGTGSLNINTGGTVITTFDGSSGVDFNIGDVTVDGTGSSWSVIDANIFSVGTNGGGSKTATITISNGGVINSNTSVRLSFIDNTGFGTSTGILNIGSGAIAGALNAPSVIGESSTATLNFNHTDANYYFTSTGAAGGTAVAITGTTLVNHIGTGKTTLTGTNTYSGGTIITAGTLQGTTTSLQGAITNNANVTFDQTAAGTYAGIISGTGSFTKSNTGTTILSGANTYSGGTTVSGGILQGTTTSLQGNISNTANVTFDQTTAGSYAGVMSGTGSFTKSNTGTTILSGTNTYTGTTILNGGTLTLQGGAAIVDTGAVSITTGTLDIDVAETIGSLAGSGSINLDAGLTVGDATNTTYAGVVQGTGSLSKQGKGTLSLTGTNTYNGGTTVSGGILQGTTTSLQGNVTNTANVTFDQTITGTYAGIISGAGSLTKSNTGTTILSGANTYSGGTTINAGTLFVNGSNSASTTTVNTGGTLGGTGTVGTININGGTFAPGNSIGTTNVAGNVDFTGGGVYQVEVDAAGNSDLISATGTATLTSGTVQVLPEAGTYNLTTDYTILTAAAGLGGTTFNSVSSNLAFLTPTLTYDATNVFLNLKRNDVSFTDVAGTPNQVAVSTLLTLLNNTNPAEFSTLLTTLFGLTTEGAQQAFDSLSGVQYTHGQVLTNKLSQQFLQLLFNRGSQNPNTPLLFNAVQQFDPLQGHLLADNSNNWETASTESGNLAGHQRGWWLQGFGGFGDIDTTENASGADYDTQGLAFGVDTEWRDFVVGLAGSYASSDADTFGGNLDIDSFQAATYTSWQRDAVYLNAVLVFGFHQTDASRAVIVGTTTSTATADYDTYNINSSIEAGKAIPLSNATTLIPFAGVAYIHSNRDDFTETGAGSANLSVNDENQDSLRTQLGLRLSHDIKTKNNKTITPTGSIAYVREMMDNVSRMEAGFTALPTTTFQVDGSDLDRDRLHVALGISGQLNERTTLNVGYQGELAGSDDSHSFAAMVRVVW